MGAIATARRLRKQMSPPEARMWLALRRLRPLGFHFRRQHALGGYFLDFVCLKRRLIVEVDGAAHDGERDRRRDAAMRQRGFRTLRYDNASVRDELDSVVTQVLEALRAEPQG